MKLYIGQKNYSSWSLRPWFALRAAGIAFEEVPVTVAGRGYTADHTPYSPNGLVPCLHDTEHGDLKVWDSLAIIEYAFDNLGNKTVWPSDPSARAHARCISAEMHSGFSNLRTDCPMNIKFRGTGFTPAGKTAEEVARIAGIWGECLDKYGGPFLFGSHPCGADAMYAPIVWRFYSYNVALPPKAVEYVKAMLSSPIMQEWRTAALAEGAALSIAHYDAAASSAGTREEGMGLYDAFLSK